MNKDRDLVSLYLEDIRNYEILTKEEEVDLLIKAHAGSEEAKNQLIFCNLRLVVNIAKGYTHKGIGFLDLISEGNIGLIHAIEKFDVSKGFRFSTYAVWWIKQSISKAIISKGREIRIPSYKHDLINKINRYIMREVMETGVYPNPEKIAINLDLNPKKVQKVLLEFQELLSLSTNIGDDIYLEDTISDDENTLEDTVMSELGKKELNSVLEVLDTREKEVLKMRYGLNGGDIHTLEEIGNAFNITRERVRQIEKKTLEKLKGRYKDRLKPYLYK